MSPSATTNSLRRSHGVSKPPVISKVYRPVSGTNKISLSLNDRHGSTMKNERRVGLLTAITGPILEYGLGPPKQTALSAEQRAPCPNHWYLLASGTTDTLIESPATEYAISTGWRLLPRDSDRNVSSRHPLDTPSNRN